MSLPNVPNPLVTSLFACLPLLLGSCGSTTALKMMPTPLVHQYFGDEAFRHVSQSDQSQDIEVFYATNRPGTGPSDNREYTNGIVEKLHLGEAAIQFGERGLLWRDVVKLSTLGKERGEIPLELAGARELDVLPDSNGKAFARAVNAKLRNSRYPDITIYIHGAKSTFPRATIQGAQFHHFMARHTALIAFSWPSTGSFLKYKDDVEYAAQSAPRLADLIEYLAKNTNARRINILTYSAGGQVAGPGLARLRNRYPDTSAAALKRRFRIGEAYFAAADVSLRTFAGEYMPTFADIVENITVTYHTKDFVLGFAQDAHKGESRLGRPDKGELTPDEIEIIETLARRTKLDAIDMEYSPVKRPVDFKAHGHWYLNEWVSSDAIIQFLILEQPKTRGLEPKPNSVSWYFPPDYPDRLEAIVREEQGERR